MGELATDKAKKGKPAWRVEAGGLQLVQKGSVLDSWTDPAPQCKQQRRSEDWACVEHQTPPPEDASSNTVGGENTKVIWMDLIDEEEQPGHSVNEISWDYELLDMWRTGSNNYVAHRDSFDVNELQVANFLD